MVRHKAVRSYFHIELLRRLLELLVDVADHVLIFEGASSESRADR